MRSFLYASALCLSIVLFGAFGGDENSDYPSGAPAGYTGSPGDGKNCTQCHNGSASNVADWITSDIPPEGYTPGTNYSITVTVTGSGWKGFEVSPQNVPGDLLGTLTAGANNHLTGSGKYVTQNARSNANPATWSFTWTAPAAGTGPVTFYGAFCVSEPVTKLCTLDVNEYTPPVPLSVIASATPSVIYLGETSQLNAEASGGSGSYTYSWTSVPAGFTSDIPDPVVQPAQTTKYFIEVNDGNGSVSDSVEVTVNSWPAGICDQRSMEAHITVSPNPTHGIVNVSFNNVKEADCVFILYDIQGNILKNESHKVIHGTTDRLDFSGLPKGVYFLRIRSAAFEKVEKIVLD